MEFYPYDYFITNSLNTETSPIIEDLLNIFGLIYIEDILTNTAEPRLIELVVPVNNPDIWVTNKELVEQLVWFVSGDKLNINFLNRTNRQRLLLSDPMVFDNHIVSLLSGGLDSLCGAYNNYLQQMDSIYVSYKTGNTDTRPQENVFNYLKDYYSNDFKCFYFPRVPFTKRFYNQRTRSLLFLSLAVATASLHSIEQIKIYENGIMSLNPPLFSRSVTRTTHPKTISYFNQLLSEIGVSVNIENPFIFKTKGQIMSQLNPDFKGIIKQTRSCSTSGRNQWYVERDKHCGFCVPCMLRKISLAAYDMEEYDCEYQVEYGIKAANLQGEYIRSEYKSSCEYFKKFKKVIDEGEIFAYLTDVKKDYYDSNADYISNTLNLMLTFSEEVGRYFSKYELY